MPPTKFHVRWLKIDFKDGSHGRHYGGHLGVLIRLVLASFDVQVTPMLPAKFQVNLAIWFRRRDEKYIFKTAAIEDILDFGSERF